MTREKMKQVRHAVKVLSTLSDSEWKTISSIMVEGEFGLGFPNNIFSEEKRYEKITRMMHQIGVPASLDGYYYLREGIFICMKEEKANEISLTRKIYPEIGKKFKISPSRVERSIRHAIEVAWSRGNIDIQEELFGYTIHPGKGKPSNREAITIIADYLKRK